MIIRGYQELDYPQVEKLYKNSSLFGGQFDMSRDSQEQLKKLIEHKPEAILVAESDGEIVGTVTLFEDGRSAWLYRFATLNNKTSEALFLRAKEILKSKGHTQVLVYAPAGDKQFEERYRSLGFNKGNDYTVYWQNL
ncbi:MAG: hypothetical protein G01um101456_599 [Parcubacteria group bacterium Gr01-1014_56]|nr:MAG: hypothetical protein G01um101456_599 [Parcubacteria group bacterium Gr01-1014_56]